MTFEQKLSKVRAELHVRGYPTEWAEGWLSMLLWKCGLKVPPVSFWHPLALAVFIGVVGPLYWVPIELLRGHFAPGLPAFQRPAVALHVTTSLLAGILIGLISRYKLKKAGVFWP